MNPNCKLKKKKKSDTSIKNWSCHQSVSHVYTKSIKTLRNKCVTWINVRTNNIFNPFIFFLKQ